MSEDKIEYATWSIPEAGAELWAAGTKLKTYPASDPITPTWPNMAYVPGVDVSANQGMVDWDECGNAGARWALARATVGAVSKDTLDPRFYTVEPKGENFRRNYDGAKQVGLPFGAYHVPVTRWSGKPVTADANMDNFFSLLEDRELDFPVVLDCELTNGDNPRHITSVIEGCIRILEDNGHDVMIYTGAWWWDGNVMPADKWRNYPLHVANYTAAAQPYMPRDWDEWAIWQWSADGNGKGHEFGADSDDIDLNRMKIEFWNKYTGVIEEPKPEPQPEPAPSKVITLQQRAICGDSVYEGEAVLNIIND